MIEWDKLKAMPEAKKTSGVRWDELKAMPDVGAIEWEEIKRLREKPIYANAIREANERLAMAESAKRPDTQYKIGLDEMWDMDYDGKSTEELLYDLACEKYGIPNDRESYLKRAGKQVLLGNYTDDVTALGTAGQMLLGLTGLDAPADVRDLYYDLTHWDWSLGHAGQTALDALSLLPGVGGIKYVDEAGEVLQNGLKRLDEARKLPEVGTKVSQSYIKGGQIPNRRIDMALGSAKAPLHSQNTAEMLTDDEWDAAMGEFLKMIDERKASEGIGEFPGDTVSGGLTGKLWRDDADKLTEGAVEGLKFKSWDDFKGYIQDVGKNGSLTNAKKIQKIQKAYDGIADKTDINIPISEKYVKGFTADGNVDYDWPKYLGFDKATITSVSRSNLLPETWDRYGSMKGSNFADIPSSGRFSYGERSIPHVENEQSYHGGEFNNAAYFDKIDAIRSGNLDALNSILRSEGLPPVRESYFRELIDKYDNFIAKTTREIGTSVDATYGLKGKVAAWGDFKGGAGQIITPINGDALTRLGIII